MGSIKNEILKKILDHRDFSTGGGSAAALAGAMGAALIAMVAKLSLGKDYGLYDHEYEIITAQALLLRDSLYQGADEDRQAFALVKAAYALPKETELKKEIRKQKIDEAYIKAAEIPLNNARLCKQTLELAESLTGKSNPGAVSDLEVSVSLVKAAVSGCLSNVVINLPAIKDRQKVDEFKEILISLS